MQPARRHPGGDALPGADSISLPAGLYQLSIPGADEDAAATGDLDVTDDLTLSGAGRDATLIDGADLDRVLHTTGSISVDVSGLTVRNGTAVVFDPISPGGQGGGVMNGSDATLTMTGVAAVGNWASHGGGGIYNAWPAATLTLVDSAVYGNTGGVSGEGIGGGGLLNEGEATLTDTLVSDNESQMSGGGIENGGELTLTRVTVSGNTVNGFIGGGIVGGGTMTITESTISGNTVSSGLPDRGEGGGMYIFGAVAITNSTISGNTAKVFGGGIANQGTPALTNVTVSGNTAPLGASIYNDPNDSVTLKSTIVAAGGGDNCAGEIISLGHNLEDGDSCGLGAAGDVANADPLLGPLADNGGPTLTHALLAGSPAVDADDNSACPDTDQRGIARPVDGNGDGDAVCDIGAYEAPEGTTPPPTPTPSPTPTAVVLPGGGGRPPAEGGGTAILAVGALVMMVGALLALKRMREAVEHVRRGDRTD